MFVCFEEAYLNYAVFWLQQQVEFQWNVWEKNKFSYLASLVPVKIFDNLWKFQVFILKSLSNFLYHSQSNQSHSPTFNTSFHPCRVCVMKKKVFLSYLKIMIARHLSFALVAFCLVFSSLQPRPKWNYAKRKFLSQQ